MSQTYRLLSTSLFHAPGMVRFLRELHLAEPVRAVEILAQGWGLESDVAEGILDGTIPTTTDADDVVVTIASDGGPTSADLRGEVAHDPR